jgi:hypothetical protein
VQALLIRGTVRRAPVTSTIFGHMSSVGGAGRDHKFVVFGRGSNIGWQICQTLINFKNKFGTSLLKQQ